MPGMTDVARVRPVEAEDLESVGAMAGELVRYHHSLDAHRFLLVEGVERGYARYFSSQLREPSTIILVAERGDRRIGYAYARLEPRDWNALLDAHGALHDIYVVPEERRSGVASLLLEEVARRLAALGAPRVVLATAVQNEAAQRLFERHGFRRTMLEMTRELGSPNPV
jgi:ribosomal protein S18 acetylase RimI-like enzyme